jgi:excisionase family DNA binding protein
LVESDNLDTVRGLTVRDIAKLMRVSRDKVLGWIRRGELRAANTADARCRKPRWVIDRADLELFRKGRQAAPPVKPRRQRRTADIDFYPE